LGLALSATVFAAATTTPSSSPRVHPSRGTTLDRVVAVVNDGVVLESDLNSEVQAVSRRLRAQSVPLPAEQVVREQVLERLVLEAIQDQHANMPVSPCPTSRSTPPLQDIARRNNVSFEQLPDKLGDRRPGLRRLPQQSAA